MNKTIVGLLGSLLLGACARLPEGDQAQTWDSHVQRGQLTNGLEYRLVRETSQPGRVDLRLTVKAGSVDESDAQIGVAHMVEHLNFYSHGGAPDDIRQRMNQWGWVQGRHYNAVTTFDRTQYLLSPTGGAKQTEQALQALSVLTLAADYSSADLDKERAVVIEEWRGGLGVAQRMNEQRTAAQRIGSRYPEHRTIGNEPAIRAATLDELKAYQQRWYVPNNMVLTIVGDIDPATLPARIEQWFGSSKAVDLPDKTWRELPLDNQLKTVGLQDSQSGSSQVAVLFRLHEPASRAMTQDGVRERLIDRFTLALMVDQLRRQPLETGVRSFSAQKNQIGEYSSVLGIAAGVQGQAHDVAQRQLLTEIERLRRFGLKAEDLEREKQGIREIAQKMLAKDGTRTFEQWVNDLNDAAIQNRLMMDKHSIARQHLAVLDSITLDDINQRLKQWTASPDQVLQLTAPGGQPLTLPTREQVQTQWAQVRSLPLEAPQPIVAKAAANTLETSDALPDLPAATRAGKVVDKRSFPREQVEYWQLSNGDRLVWLKRAFVAQAGSSELLLKSLSNAGFNSRALPVWRSQLAAQLAEQQAPPGWTLEQLKRWRQAQGINLSHEQEADQLQVLASTFDKGNHLPVQQRLHAMLQAYRLSQAPLHIDAATLQSVVQDLQATLSQRNDNVRSQQQQALSTLRFGTTPWQTPTAEQIQALRGEQLQSDWQQLSQTPVTHYLMADVPAEQLQALVEQELAGIPRGNALHSEAPRQRSGHHVQDLNIGIEPRTQLQANSYRDQPWTPEDAARISALQGIAQAALKQQLRGEATGVYSLTFETTLDPRSQRIDSKLQFYTDPARANELWALARTTLARLPQTLDEAAVIKARKQLLQQERLNRDNAQTQLRRLILSDQRWGDPRYLSQQVQLPEAISYSELKRLAGALFNERNLVLQRLNPVDKAVTVTGP
ncbi:insulinase family protein [Pseudomonas sp. 3A(2025)]